ncbi:MAG: endolytic transglycosylase MltG [Lachnospiraceae bacterium]|nr:endolytic transglycosylase MltG [Lachnospiraceae bacterium]
MKSNVKRIILLVFEWLIIALLCYGAYVGYSFFKEYKRATINGVLDYETVVVNDGDGIRDIAETLKSSGVIKYKTTFLIKAFEDGYAGKFQPGTYEVSREMSLKDVCETLTYVETDNTPVVETTRFTIPEGYSVEMMGKRLEEKGLCKAEEFYAAANKTDYGYDFLNDIPDKGQKYKLQGFLFPDTYEIYVGSSAEEIVMKMLDGFASHLKEFDGYSGDYSMYDLVTIASIVEREAKLDEERPLIAGVVYNRLNINMKLQMCPTVLYAITEGYYDVNQVLYSDLEVDDPYNTYVYEGLPIGPICCPGLASLKAAINPEESTYLFYHTDDETVGNHIFSETYEEHLDSRIKK